MKLTDLEFEVALARMLRYPKGVPRTFWTTDGRTDHLDRSFRELWRLG
jgi:hypothetical protein